MLSAIESLSHCVSFNPQSKLVREALLLFFTDEETEA